MTLKSENALLLMTRNQVVLQGTNKSFQDVYLDAKVYWISTASLWNFITLVILVHMYVSNFLLRWHLPPNWDVDRYFCWDVLDYNLCSPVLYCDLLIHFFALSPPSSPFWCVYEICLPFGIFHDYVDIFCSMYHQHFLL